MDSELLSWGKEKVNRIRKIMPILALGLFFSFYFCENIFAVSPSESNLGVTLKKSEKSEKEASFKFDPMERVRDSIAQVKLVEEKERKLRTDQKKKALEPKNSLEQKYQNLIADSPLEEMLPFIVKCDNETASFLIAIAKKESDFGKHSPQKNGRNCFNYWGYRGTYNQTDSGYSCFDSPEQAIAVVGERISELISQKINTAEKMVVWKCGSTCAGHDPASVKKWINDVALYYGKANS